MNSYLILYPAFLMILLTFFLYLKNRLDANKAYKSGDIKCNVADDFKWISPRDIIDYPFPKANHHIFPHIINNKLKKTA